MVNSRLIGWGSGRIKEQELLDEYRWMEQLGTAGKSYYSINEVKPWHNDTKP